MSEHGGGAIDRWLRTQVRSEFGRRLILAMGKSFANAYIDRTLECRPHRLGIVQILGKRVVYCKDCGDFRVIP